jgi:hypothetical protein
MGERFVVWLGANTATSSASGYVPGDTFGTADAENVARVQRLMGDTPDGWLGPTQWTRLMNEGPPELTELRTNGIGPLWFGMTGAQVEASGVATVTEGTADAPGSFVKVTGIDGSGCFSGSLPAGVFTTFTTTDPSVRTPEGITANSSVADLQGAYGSRLTARTMPSSPRDVTVFVVREGDYSLAFWPPGPDMGFTTPLVLFAGRNGEIDDLHPQSGWCFG